MAEVTAAPTDAAPPPPPAEAPQQNEQANNAAAPAPPMPHQPGPPMPPNMMQPPPHMMPPGPPPHMMPQPPFGPPAAEAGAPTEANAEPAVELEEPNQTLYINNLSERVKEDELKKALEAIFNQFGKILRVVAMSSFKRRGQAFVVFDSIEAAEKALNAMQSFPFCGKPMRINFAKTKSDIVAKNDGAFKPRVKAPLGPRPTPPGGGQAPYPGAGEYMQAPGSPGEPSSKRGRYESGEAAPPPPPGPPGQTAPSGHAPAAPPPNMAEDPSPILFLENLPSDRTQEMLTALFKEFPGFKEVRLVPIRPDIGFVEYENEVQASAALPALNGKEVTPGNKMRVSFSKKR
ncbi:uncharacterized protein MONBRDRAFT_39189 [Monosiga brevicollis MX1]|uniref:RRM domain-containing protein n=1 Tax=Monosiga brevicollis TaxID=81824 RepID=A9VCS6_MONBE|nr:uncharacterized protein MONBRDRAFT_39189 [Monosiga brevicollis MX1]EDQ84646.1 predicted protein [Monosiga brevicollis MX1]|eukprot:XP_001750550.1 hypothetical protein [Monosiga brevicollis MX1]